MRITKKDRAPVDPFSVEEAEALIAALHRDWGEAQGNYDEFRFFTGLRPSEQIALLVLDCDLSAGTVKVTKARVLNRDKDRTKTNVDRAVELCPRALEVLKGQLALRDRFKAAGLLSHDKLFCKEDGGEIANLQFGYERWGKTVNHSVGLRYREPYNARHTCVTWNLMVGKNLLWCSKQHGHSVQVMLSVYAAWSDGGQGGEAEIAAIKAAMQTRPPALLKQIDQAREREVATLASPLGSPEAGSRLAVRRGSEVDGRSKRLRRRRRWGKPVRAFDPYTLSRGAPSTTRPSLRRSIRLPSHLGKWLLCTRLQLNFGSSAVLRFGQAAAKAGKNTDDHPSGKGLDAFEAFAEAGPRKWVTGPRPRLASCQRRSSQDPAPLKGR